MNEEKRNELSDEELDEVVVGVTSRSVTTYYYTFKKGECYNSFGCVIYKVLQDYTDVLDTATINCNYYFPGDDGWKTSGIVQPVSVKSLLNIPCLGVDYV